MKCILPAVNVKLFAKAIHCLAKIGSEIYFEPLENGLALKTVNLSRSAYVCFLFMRSMFHVYEHGCGDVTVNGDAVDTFKCKVAVKTMLQVFKSLSSIERSVESCDINLDEEECRLVFQLKCRHGITKTHQLTFQECDSIQAVFAKDLLPNILKCEHKLLSDVVVNFSPSLEEISLCVTPCRVNMKSYTDSDDEASLTMRTEMSLNPEEFADFQIGVDTDVTFSLKDLRAILAFCDVACIPIQLFFEGGGKPLIFTVEQENYFRANFVLATIANDEFSSQRENNVMSNTAFKTKMVNGSKNLQVKKSTTKSVGARYSRTKQSSINQQKTSSVLPNGSSNSTEMSNHGRTSPLNEIVEDTTRNNGGHADGSPEIPDQNFAVGQDHISSPVEPEYRDMREVFFAPCQNDDHTIVVLAPDSDEET
ncbi:cell cycle checkpoint control protein RAD9A-like [Clavelina lepadiformis]|uniref:cell cycle checkpoint control protein RAD9A-like n=1 Tax=Clavelina lepadiformis TaxID=159417 RepID=UPI004040F4CB